MPPTTYTMVAFIKRKEGMSVADFNHHWEAVHGPLVKPWAEKYGMTYKQIFIGSDTPLGDTSSAALAPYDGCAVFEMADADVIRRAWKDEYFQRDVTPDQALFMQESQTIMTTGGTVTIA
ncbi:Dimeric alpha-beta barrel [Niveomyces insectorum RCEF 264]|uniref:Dimeric alpha-beta barrel n=1 Tax=Niveomyces insectorum RCEF 264 TaxID=1081102 RepID=A0A167YVW3_9HYPO|nr:Dimeric alpha-beta barrel [Niveomyces insectorum RCEF 264]